MPRSRLFAAGCLAIVFAFGLTGCSPAVPKITETPEPVMTAPFKTEEEALKAATEAYEKYVEVSTEIFRDGGAGVERITGLAIESALEDVTTSASDFAESGAKMTGKVVTDSIRLQSFTAEGEPGVVLYACRDVSGTDAVDSSGHSIVEPGRKLRLPRQVVLEVTQSGNLAVAEDSSWTGQDFCN